MSDIKAGDVVVLKSGGPKMTVSQVDKTQFDDKLSAWCEWFDGKKFLKEVIHIESLKLASDDIKDITDILKVNE